MTTARGYSAILENTDLTVKETVEKVLRINFYLDAYPSESVSDFGAWDRVHLPSSPEDVDGIQNFHDSVNQFIADAQPVRDHMSDMFTAVRSWGDGLVGDGIEVARQRGNLKKVLYIVKSKFDVINADIHTMEKIRDDSHYLDNYFESKRNRAEIMESRVPLYEEKRRRKEEDIASTLASAPEGIN